MISPVAFPSSLVSFFLCIAVSPVYVSLSFLPDSHCNVTVAYLASGYLSKAGYSVCTCFLYGRVFLGFFVWWRFRLLGKLKRKIYMHNYACWGLSSFLFYFFLAKLEERTLLVLEQQLLSPLLWHIHFYIKLYKIKFITLVCFFLVFFFTC